MRTELYQPQLSDRNNRQDWEREGAKSAQDRATEIVGEILAKPEILVLSSEIRTEIRKEIPGLQDSII
jgi:trimethylamine:corrinoid methyltransferase-like protein